jgi:hypothetical protein
MNIGLFHCNLVLFEKLIVIQLVKEVPIFYGNMRFYYNFWKKKKKNLPLDSIMNLFNSVHILWSCLLILLFHLYWNKVHGYIADNYWLTYVSISEIVVCLFALTAVYWNMILHFKSCNCRKESLLAHPWGFSVHVHPMWSFWRIWENDVSDSIRLG